MKREPEHTNLYSIEDQKTRLLKLETNHLIKVRDLYFIKHYNVRIYVSVYCRLAIEIRSVIAILFRATSMAILY